MNDAYQSTYSDALYFATDKGVLYLNGKDYGSEFPYENVELVGNELILTFRDPSLGEDGKKVINLIEELQKATSTQDGLMSKEYAALLDQLSDMMENDEFGKVDGVANGDKILSVSEKLVSATLDLHYGEEAGVKYIYLLGNPSEEEGAVEGRAVVAKLDAAPFVADGMLQDAEFVTKESEDGVAVKGIEFTWNVTGEDGQYKTDFVPLEDLIVEYSAGNGINVENNVVSVKLDETKTRNLLSVSANGLALESVPTDATVLQQDIVVAGINGTLGTGAYANGTTIKAGTSIYTILQNILCKEQYPDGLEGRVEAKVSRNASLTSAYAKPSFQLTSSGTTVEVGTTVTASAITGYDPTATKKSRTYTGFEYGYSLATGDDQVIVTGNPSSVDVTELALETGTYSLKREFTKFGSPSTETSTSSVASTECKFDAVDLVVEEGDNKVKVTMSGPGHKGVVEASPAYYMVSNLGNTNENKVVASVAKADLSVATADSSYQSLTVTGRYRFYYGYPSSVPTSKTEIVALANKSFITSDTISVTTAGTVPVGKYMVAAAPEGFEYTSFVNGMGLDDVSAFYTATEVVDYELPNGTVVKYNVHWYGPMGAATNYNSFTLKK